VDESWLDKRLAAEIASHGIVRPPYQAYPMFTRYDVMWRMGEGQEYLDVWYHWWKAAHLDEAAKLNYYRAHEPPAAWMSWAAETIWPVPRRILGDFAGDRSKLVDDMVRRLAAHGIGDHDAWRAWESDAEV